MDTVASTESGQAEKLYVDGDQRQRRALVVGCWVALSRITRLTSRRRSCMVYDATSHACANVRISQRPLSAVCICANVCFLSVSANKIAIGSVPLAVIGRSMPSAALFSHKLSTEIRVLSMYTRMPVCVGLME